MPPPDLTVISTSLLSEPVIFRFLRSKVNVTLYDFSASLFVTRIQAPYTVFHNWYVTFSTIYLESFSFVFAKISVSEMSRGNVFSV